MRLIEKNRTDNRMAECKQGLLSIFQNMLLYVCEIFQIS